MESPQHSNSSKPMKTLFFCLPAVILATSAQGALTSFTDNFDSYTAGEPITSPWTYGDSAATSTQQVTEISPGNLGYTQTLTGSGSGYITTSLGSGTDFAMSVRFRMDALSGGSGGSATMNQSLSALGNNISASSGSAYRLSYVPVVSDDVIQNYGRLILSETNSTGIAGTLTSADRFILPESDVGAGARFYTLRLTGTYTDGSLTLLGALLDDTESVLLTVDGTDASPLAGEYFGLRFASNSSLNTGAVTYDDFSVIAVPEPAAAGLAGIGLLGLLLRRPTRR